MAAVVRQRREVKRERRRFKAHDQLLVSVIKRQAGSLWKAILEGVMNAIDAGATRCEINLTQQSVRIKDNGKGFQSKQEIDQFFETFGQPHEDMEDKVFGQFRMGRGQLFAYGVNTWRTGKFSMSVDINKDGMDWDLIEDLADEPGCHISVELYQQLTHTALAEMVAQLEQNCRYVSMELLLNGRQINSSPASSRWDMETAEADIRFRNSGNLVIYNQGIKVCERGRHWLGVGGDVVTKQNLRVNFARNDIMSDCPVWAKIQASILAHTNASATGHVLPTRPQARQRRAAPARLTEDDRIRLCNQAKDGALTRTQLTSAKVMLPLCSGQNLSITQVYNRGAGRITAPPSAEYPQVVYGLTIAQHKLAFPLHTTTLQRWGCQSCADLAPLLRRLTGYIFVNVPWDVLVKDIGAHKSIVEEDALTRTEAIVLATVRKNARGLTRRRISRSSLAATTRDVHIGDASDGSRSWTDGKHLIAISRDAVRRTGCGQMAWVYYGLLIMHEMGHTTTSMRPHDHTEAFYEEYHDSLMQQYPSLLRFAERCASDCAGVAERIGRRLSRTELRQIDSAEARQRRVAAVAGAEAVAVRAEEQDVQSTSANAAAAERQQ